MNTKNNEKWPTSLYWVGAAILVALAFWVSISSVLFLNAAGDFIRGQLEGRMLPPLTQTLIALPERLPWSFTTSLPILLLPSLLILAFAFLLQRGPISPITRLSRHVVMTTLVLSCLIGWVLLMLVSVSLPFVRLGNRLPNTQSKTAR